MDRRDYEEARREERFQSLQFREEDRRDQVQARSNAPQTRERGFRQISRTRAEEDQRRGIKLFRGG